MSSVKQCYYFRITSKVINSLDLSQKSSSDSDLENWDQTQCYSETTMQLRNCFRWCTALIIQKKADMLWCSFFSEESQANLSNINDFEYEQAVESLLQIIKNDILNIMNKQKKFSTSDIDETLNTFLKIMRKSFAKAIAALIQACWQLIYYLKHFYRVRTVILYKVEKDFYISSHFWRLIVLLNTVEKIIETVTAEQIQRMTKKHNMLSAHQMSVCQDQFTETALNLLVNQVHKIWWNEDHVISLLSLDITEIYDQVMCSRMMHVLQIKEISEQLMKWVWAFMTDRTSILVLSDTETEEKLIFAEVLQESSLSFILYLFYMIEFLKTCNSIRDQLSTSAFINDIILLIYEQITERNCQILESMHDQCMNWTHYYRAFFVLKKYDLIHLFRRFKKFNMQA